MKVSVIGTGYVGLVAGACFADVGHTVYCVDIDEQKIKNLKNGILPIYEPGLEEIVKRTTQSKNLKFTTSKKEAIQDSEVIFLALGTPSQSDGSVDLKYVHAAALELGEVLNGPKIIVNKSTVPVGTHKKVKDWVESKSQYTVEVVSNPEFLKEGTAVNDFQRPDRVVIGTKSDAAFEAMHELYKPFLRQGNPILRMDPVSAEVTKYACNSFLATRISFMNELANFCESVGADIEWIRKGMATDQRIGRHFLYAGVGFGGSCFPKDVREMVQAGRKADSHLTIIESAYQANERQKHRLTLKVFDHYGKDLSGKSFGIWGLSFKPNTDDIREAPSRVVMQTLLEHGAKIKAYDPIAMEEMKKAFQGNVEYCESPEEAVRQTDGLLLVTEWNVFKNPDFKKLKSLMRTPVIFDGRNVYEPSLAKKEGFQYWGIGRGYEPKV